MQFIAKVRFILSRNFREWRHLHCLSSEHCREGRDSGDAWWSASL